MRRREHYIIDGYNVIHAWPELKALQSNLSEARDRLIHVLSEYGAYENLDITIVFDALFTEDEEHTEKPHQHFEIIYTGAGETADSRIERIAYESVRRGREVHVVSSDGAVESVILGAGAYRHPSAEFRRAVRKAKKQIQQEYLGPVTLPLVRNEVGGQLDADTSAKLDAFRKRRD
ncbi:MAG: NYN domain-containing protein [Selenomonadaceae bacterium]|nr:NYN domain-containing protein [Selenomonadaceae bacterium]